ncbi:hypothetical protein GCM10007880_66950 [Mesorhizobium amorphae]|nr:hypothetical protein GCM10007880_66950 [Mesorhizobium amorphae]
MLVADARKAPTKDHVWHLHEVAIRINCQKCGFWRAVDQDGSVPDQVVQTRRNTKAVRRMLTRLLKKQGLPPKRMITDKMRSYGAAKRQLMPNVEHRSHKRLNNRAENSPLPFRKRERTRLRFRSVGPLQHFVSIFSAVQNRFLPSQTKPLGSANSIPRQSYMGSGECAVPASRGHILSNMTNTHVGCGVNSERTAT